MRSQDPEDRAELRLTLLLAAALVLFAGAAEVVGRLLADPGAVPYLGGDNGVYFGYMEQVRQGSFLFRDLYTTEPQPHGFLNVFWLALGLVARVTGMTPDVVFFLTRLAFAPVVAGAVLFASRTFLSDAAARRVALPLAVFGSGLGAWVVVVRSLAGFPPAGDALPIDLWVPEMSVTLSSLATPHFLASIAAIVAILSLTFRYAQQPTARRAVAAAVLMLLLGQFHTYYVPLVGAAAAAGMLALAPTGRRFWQSLGFLALLAAAGICGALPYAWLSATDLTTMLRNATNRTPMLDWWAALAGVGMFLPFAAAGVLRGTRDRTASWRFLCAWVAVQAAFVIAPLPWQRKMTEALVVPLALLAAPEVARLWRACAARLPGGLRPLRFLIAGTAAFLLFGASTLMQAVIAGGPTVFPSRITPLAADHAAFSWMRSALPADAVVVAAAERGNAVAAFTGRRVYAGHWSETVNIDVHLTALDWLGNGAASDAARLRFLRRAGITHVYVSPLERDVWTWDPARTGLPRTYANDAVTIYAVPPAAGRLQEL